MKRVRINTGKAALVFKNREFKRVITAGIHWLRWGERVLNYDLGSRFESPVAMEILLADAKFASMIHLVEVPDNQLSLVYVNGRFSEVLTTGRYMYWNGLVTYSFTAVDLNKIYITEAVEPAILNSVSLRQYIRTFEVEAYEKAVLLVDDTYVKTLSGGVYRFWTNNTSIKIAKVDMRQLQLEMTGQELLTKDKANIRINMYAQYQVLDVEKAMLDSKDYQKQLYLAIQLALRAYVGNYTLDELLENKVQLAGVIVKSTKSTVSALGVTILNCGIRDIILPGEMKTIMNQVLMAQKKAQANVITRREETASTRSLLNTAKLMEDNAMLFKLKEMEYIEKIAEKIGEITVTANGNAIEQLKEIFTVNK